MYLILCAHHNWKDQLWAAAAQSLRAIYHPLLCRRRRRRRVFAAVIVTTRKKKSHIIFVCVKLADLNYILKKLRAAHKMMIRSVCMNKNS